MALNPGHAEQDRIELPADYALEAGSRCSVPVPAPSLQEVSSMPSYPFYSNLVPTEAAHTVAVRIA